MNGYVKKQIVGESTKYDNKYPIELNKVISQFLGNILLRFDTTHNNFRQFIKNGEQTISVKTMQADKLNVGQFVIASSYEISSGMTESIRIKCVKAGSYLALGITSNIEHSKLLKPDWINDQTGHKYWWYRHDADKVSAYIFAQHNDWPLYDYVPLIGWDDHDVIGINIDCNQWIIAFYKNELKIGSFPLEKNLKYHFFMTFQLVEKWKESQYTLL